MRSTTDFGKWNGSVRITSILFLAAATFGFLQANSIYLIEQLHMEFGASYYIAVIVNFTVCIAGAFGIELLVRTAITRLQKLGVTHRSVEHPIIGSTRADDAATGTVATPIYHFVSSNLNTRVDNLQKRATTMYWSILIIIGAGIWIIIFAGYLTDWDTVSAGIWSRITSEQSDLDNSVDKRLTDFLRTSRERNKTLDQNDIKTFVDTMKSDPDTQQRYADIEKQRDNLVATLISDMKVRAAAGRSWNLSGTILRVTIIGLLIFLVQILIQLYRYNSRLIAFYSSRRDALILAKGKLKESSDFAKLLVPTGLDFGRDPNHPFVEAAQFLFSRRGQGDKGASAKAGNGASAKAGNGASAKAGNGASAKAANGASSKPGTDASDKAAAS
jgi:hypothetical protein